ERIGLRAAGSPSWQLVAYTGTLGGAPITPEQLPREGGPLWPEDDDARTGAAIEAKIEQVFRYGKMEGLGWRGASDAWLEKWWPRFAAKIAEGLASSYYDEEAPVVDAEGLVVATGEEIRGTTLLPPTRAGWQRFLELAPKSGESFSTLKAIGLGWWGRKIPQNLLSAAEERGEEEGEGEGVKERVALEPVAAAPEPAVSIEAPPVSPSPPLPEETPDELYEEARAAIRALELPWKKTAAYISQAEQSIAAGRGYLAVVERARRAAAKGSEGAKLRVPSSPSRRRSEIEVALDTFNAEPGWRLAVARTLPNGHVLVVAPEGAELDPEAAVASVDVIDFDIDDVRWLDDRLSPAEQDAILERVEGALWAAFDASGEEREEGEPPSPLGGLIEAPSRRSRALGARPERSLRPTRTDGYAQVAEALRELAEPAGQDADELQRWLEVEDLMAAGDVVGQASRADAAPLRKLMGDLWDAILDEVPVVEVFGAPGQLRVSASAIFGVPGEGFVLERVVRGERAAIRRIRVRQGEGDARRDVVSIDDPTDRLQPGARVHTRARDEEFLGDLYQKIGAFHDDLVRAPRTLRDVRLLLYWTGVMLDAPLCQGDVKARAVRAFSQAKAYYDTARQRLAEGRSADAVRRIHAALRRISAAAAELAQSCGEGQITLGVEPSELAVRPEDDAVIVGGGEDEGEGEALAGEGM
ncbi:MAG: hypothetical protein KC420_11685, partial [Myxococcales bacterium]|nr:hypothetical protein [Myxococcales bacterium]